MSDSSSVKKVAGDDGPYATGLAAENANASSVVVTVEGIYADLEDEMPSRGDDSAYLPDGYTVESAFLASTGDGLGKLTIKGVAYGSGSDVSSTPEKTTWEVDMQSVVHDLVSHPKLAEEPTALAECVKWLATDPSERIGGENGYRYKEADDFADVEESYAIDFCAAYSRGITTYVSYEPVVMKISIYKRLPGASMAGASTTGGTAKFSTCGEWDDPDLVLQGYSRGHWLKTGDRWVQNADTSWQRTEQWTYSPEGRDGDSGWIYDSSGR